MPDLSPRQSDALLALAIVTRRKQPPVASRVAAVMPQTINHQNRRVATSRQAVSNCMGALRDLGLVYVMNAMKDSAHPPDALGPVSRGLGCGQDRGSAARSGIPRCQNGGGGGMNLFFDLIYVGGVISVYPALRVAGKGRYIAAATAAIWPVAAGMAAGDWLSLRRAKPDPPTPTR
tara:strand:- start:33904 stop:34431 length:528 start_codon:yes stop_codon:yes gene_type:complete